MTGTLLLTAEGKDRAHSHPTGIPAQALQVLPGEIITPVQHQQHREGLLLLIHRHLPVQGETTQQWLPQGSRTGQCRVNQRVHRQARFQQEEALPPDPSTTVQDDHIHPAITIHGCLRVLHITTAGQ